jgi:uncharacterized protein
MKSMGGSGEMGISGMITPEEGLRYAMSLPVATTISGMDSLTTRPISLARRSYDTRKRKRLRHLGMQLT